MMEVTRTKTEGEVIWLDALIDGIRGKTGDEQGEIVGQNVKLELIRAHREANEWPIVIVDRQARRNNPGFVLRVHLSVPHFLTTWTRREYWASYRKLTVIVSSNARSKLFLTREINLSTTCFFSVTTWHPEWFALMAHVHASRVLWCMDVVARLRALFELNRGENGTGRWLLSLADHSTGTLAALYSPLPSLAHTLSRALWSAGPAGSVPTICRGGQEPSTPRRWCMVSGCCLPPHPTVTSSTLHHIEPEVGHTPALIALNAQSVWVRGFALRVLRTTRVWNYTWRKINIINAESYDVFQGQRVLSHYVFDLVLSPVSGEALWMAHLAQLVWHFGQDWNILTAIECAAMWLGTNVHGRYRMNLTGTPWWSLDISSSATKRSTFIMLSEVTVLFQKIFCYTANHRALWLCFSASL